MTEVKIVADSLNVQTNNRLTTFLVTYPRYIHAELMTHRMFSRNAASSRAIPITKFREDVIKNPVVPNHWGTNKPGMQAGTELDDQLQDWLWEKDGAVHKISQREFAYRTWFAARDLALGAHLALEKVGLHKQIANRVIEPWFHIQVLLSATEFENWFALRCHKDAHPDIQVLADAMLEAYVLNKPADKMPGEWHLPFGDQDIPEDMDHDTVLKVCTARAARVSYKNFDGEIDTQKDVKLHDRLKKSGHWSPFEHVAQASRFGVWSGNFCGWLQYRKQFESENRKVQDLNELWEERKRQRGLASLLT